MSERKPLLCETIKYIIIGHGKQVFHKYLVKHQEFNSKIKPTIRNEKKKKKFDQPSKQTKDYRRYFRHLLQICNNLN